MKSLLLDQTAWDLVLDASGNIALGSSPYAIAQDVSCACKLFKGELWYNKKAGIPYFDQILGQWPPLALVKAWKVSQALTVPGVDSAEAVITGVNGRAITGQIKFKPTDTTPAFATFNTVSVFDTNEFPDGAIIDSDGNAMVDSDGNFIITF